MRSPQRFSIGDRSGEWAGQGDDGVLLLPEERLDDLGGVCRGPILLEDDPLESLKVEIDGVGQLLFQDTKVGLRIEAVRKRAGVANTL